MSFCLEQVVPWGRSFEEYAAMFALDDRDLRKRILGCGDGPASFNSVLTRRGGQVVSVDPLYSFSATAIRRRIGETRGTVLEQARNNRDAFNWTTIRSVEELGRLRMTAMQAFLSDYPAGLEQGRYVVGKLPDLPFADGEFGLALCSHLLFLYSEHLSLEMHLASVRELCRVAGEVRIFPLVELGGTVSRHLGTVCDTLRAENFDLTIRAVEYEFQKGANQMLIVTGGI